MKILMTGSSGFIGNNVLSILDKNMNYDIYTPKRNDLNLKDEQSVSDYLAKEKFDVVLHFASPTPGKNKLDSYETLVEDGLRIFMNLYNHRNLFGKMIYTGSGAEFDKSRDINRVEEENCFLSIPKDSYGFAKMMMNQLAQKSDNIYNFRIFGCYGPGDHESKFITHCIRSILLNRNVTIRKDCKFDYIHVYDFARFIEWGINHEMKFHDYNVSSGQCFWLSEIAECVCRNMNSKVSVELLSEEKNYNYSANSNRIKEESKLDCFYSLEDGIKMQIEWEISNWTENTKFDGK